MSLNHALKIFVQPVDDEIDVLLRDKVFPQSNHSIKNRRLLSKPLNHSAVNLVARHPTVRVPMIVRNQIRVPVLHRRNLVQVEMPVDFRKHHIILLEDGVDGD